MTIFFIFLFIEGYIFGVFTPPGSAVLLLSTDEAEGEFAHIWAFCVFPID